MAAFITTALASALGSVLGVLIVLVVQIWMEDSDV